MLRTLSVHDPGRLVILKWKAKGIPTTKGSSSYANCPPGSGPTLEGGDIISDVPLDAGGCSFSLPFFEQLQSERNVFSDVAAFVPADLTVNSDGRTSRVRGMFVSGNFFSTLGVNPELGHLLSPSDDSEAAPTAIVVSHGFWQGALGGDRFIAGKQVLIGKTLFTVIGVTAPEFAQLDPGLACDLWLPLAFNAPKETAANAIWIELIGRLKPKTSTGQAASALSAAFSASTTTGPEAIFKTADAPQIELGTAAHGLATLRRFFSQALFALLAVVALVLLISCVNIAGLMLVRSAARRKELGLRVALGATRGRIVSQLLTESLLLAFMGAPSEWCSEVWGLESSHPSSPEIGRCRSNSTRSLMLACLPLRCWFQSRLELPLDSSQHFPAAGPIWFRRSKLKVAARWLEPAGVWQSAA